MADEQIEINFDGTHIIGHLYQNHPIIYQNREDYRLHMRMMEWGCVPFYVKDLQTFARQRASMLNARSERILEDTKSYWYKIRNRRCLIPLNGFYEHRKLRAIKNIALDFWKEQLIGAQPNHYVFSSNFLPGKFKLQPKRITYRWKEYVKDDLKIDIDFYALKHLNLDETAALLNTEAASDMAGHSSPVITMKHYLFNEEQRKLEKLKTVNNKFA